MEEWIYLKNAYNGLDEIKAAAMAAVMHKSQRHFKVVHTSVSAKYLFGLDNVEIGYPDKNDSIIVTIELPDNSPFCILCKKVAEVLNIQDCSTWEPYLGFVQKDNEVDRQLSKIENVFLFCYYLYERKENILDNLNKAVELMSDTPINIICCGPKREKMIKGAWDFRELIQIDELIRNRGRIKAIVTSSPFVREIGLLLHITVIYLYTNAFVVCRGDKKEVISGLTGYSKKLADRLSDLDDNRRVIMYSPQPQASIASIPVIKKFEVPYNFDEELVDYYESKSNYINYLFLPPFADDLINTRTCMQQSKFKGGGAYMPETREEYEYHIRLINEHNLKIVVLWQDMSNVISKDMLDYYTGLGAIGFIIANDKNAKIIKDYNPKLLVIASIVQRICKGIGERDFRLYDYIVLFYPFNRSLNIIKRLTHLKDKMIIMPNTFCHTDCQGVQHWFVKDIRSFDFDKLCPAYNDPSKSTLIRPEHLFLFDDYVGGYKLQGRELKTDDIVTLCEAYFYRNTPYGFIPTELANEFDKQMQDKSLEDYYNTKESEIETLKDNANRFKR